MGFFKNIGKSISGFVKKNINFKKLVSVAGNFDPTGIIAGQQQEYYEKKDAREQQAEYIKNAHTQPRTKNPNIGQILTAGGAGALHGVADSLAGTTQAGELGAKLGDNVLMSWLKHNWWKALLGVSGITALVIVIVKATKGKHHPVRRRY